ncbi:CocE/NonD family hydrolase [Chloroflexota bacterium]
MTDTPQQKTEIRTYGGEKIEVILRKAIQPDDSNSCPEFKPSICVENGICYERDVAVKMRDGVTIYTDVYRPEGVTNVPAIIAWSPYGKRAGYLGISRHGVPPDAVSPMAKFEAPDPKYWCHSGYAIINPDVRGAFHSEGDIQQFNSKEGQDGYDLIEWVAAQRWCNGKVSLSGNSWLGISQWFIAAEKPPHLACIAPWEGFDDFYRDSLFQGGVPETGFFGVAQSRFCGPGYFEDIPVMIRKYPMINAYWEDKIAKVEKIEIPAYVVSSYNPIHTHGTFDGFCRMASRKKWLRVHNTQEWPDLYMPENLEDLRRFYDRYLKDIHNGWEFTPRVRISVLDPGGCDIVNRPEDDWPLPDTQFQKSYLDATTMKLSPELPVNESLVRYCADDDKGQAVFTMKFPEDTEITGYIKLRLWVEADGSDDMDLFVYVSKTDAQGNPLLQKVINFPHPGARGLLRVSHRELDEKRSTPSQPYLTHQREQLLKPGEIVPVEIGIWPWGMLWHAGQQLRVAVQGFNLPWLEDVMNTQREDGMMAPGTTRFHYERRNNGYHVIHTGGKYDSHLLVPWIPPRFPQSS